MNHTFFHNNFILSNNNPFFFFLEFLLNKTKVFLFFILYFTNNPKGRNRIINLPKIKKQVQDQT